MAVMEVNIAELSRQAEQNRVTTQHALNTLIATLNAASSQTEEVNFSRLIGLAQTILEYDDLQMSRFLKVSRPTVSRWVRGVTAPHPLGRKAIFDVMAERASARVRSLRA